MLNLVIALIGSMYDQMITRKKISQYEFKAQYNEEYFIIQTFLGRLYPFQQLVQTMDVELESKNMDESAGIIDTLKEVKTLIQNSRDQNSQEFNQLRK